MEDTTSDFVYVRLHGDKQLYVSGYTAGALRRWERKIRAWTRGGTPKDARLVASRPGKQSAKRDIFVYFDNDVKVRAPFDAMSLAHRLGLRPAPSAPPDEATIKEVPRPASGDRRWRIATRRLRD
jgi:uncharacterized protein YecE (DUF72 family)